MREEGRQRGNGSGLQQVNLFTHHGPLDIYPPIKGAVEPER